MSDIYLGWNGDVEFAANGDFRMTSLQELAEQRLVRRLLTNPAVRDANGVIIRLGDDLTNQDYGKGLGRQVDGLMTVENKQLVDAWIRAAVLEESEYIDVSVPPIITFEDFSASSTQVVTVEFQIVSGDRASINLSL